MKTALMVAACLATGLSACTPPATPAAPAKFFIVYGDSQTSVGDAVLEAQLALKRAVDNGYRPVSVGGGVGSAAFVRDGLETKPQAGSVISVTVLVEGPASAPDLLPNGTAVP